MKGLLGSWLRLFLLVLVPLSLFQMYLWKANGYIQQWTHLHLNTLSASQILQPDTQNLNRAGDIWQKPADPPSSPLSLDISPQNTGSLASRRHRDLIAKSHCEVLSYTI